MLPAISCSRHEISTPDDGNTVRFIPEPVIGAAASTRARIDGTWQFPILEYGLYVEGVNAQTTAWYHGIGYDNIMAMRDKGKDYDHYTAWKFTPKGAPNYAFYIGLFKNRGPVTFYAMSPYNAGFSAVNREIAFDVRNNVDYLYTGPVAVDPDVLSSLRPVMNFKHAMTLIELAVSTTMVGTLYVTGVTFETLDSSGNPAAMFYMTGKFNPITGKVTPDAGSLTSKLEQNDRIAVEYIGDKASSPICTYIPFFVPQMNYTAGSGAKLKMTVRFEYSDKEAQQHDDEIFGSGSSVTFRLDDILTGGTAQGFLAGYRYYFPVKVDNFIKYFGYPVVQEWETDADDQGEEKIYEIVL